MTERGGEVERGVGEAKGSGIGIVEEVRMGFEDAPHKEGVRCMDCAAEAEGGVNHGEVSGTLEALTGREGILGVVFEGDHTSYQHSFKFHCFKCSNWHTSTD